MSEEPLSFVVEAKKKPTLELRRKEIDVGARSTCDVAIDDPLVAQVHCRIRREGTRFLIEDAGSATGTFRNGSLLEEAAALESGDVVVLGVSKIVVDRRDEDGDAVLVLEVKERSFFFQGFDKKNPGRRGDPDRWVQAELEFGRWPTLAKANVLAGLGAALLLGTVFVGVSREPLVDPGPLHASHAALFDEEAAGTGSLRHEVVIATDQGCSACHEAFAGVTLGKCGQCHAELMRDQHPFRSEAGDETELPGAAWTETACVACHVDHEAHAGWSFVPEPARTEEACENCHPSGLPAVSRTTPAEVRWVERKLGYDGFPHAAHLRGGSEIACATCHVLAPMAAEVRDRFEGDFPAVSYEVCMGCHASDERARDTAHRAHWAEQALFPTTWHGAEQNGGRDCLRCHAEVYREELRTIASAMVEERRFRVPARDHADEFMTGAHAGDRRCVECHVDGPVQVGARGEAGPFWHGLHLSILARPGVEGAAVDRVLRECDACHRGRRSSDHLSSEPYFGPDAEVCSECHDAGRIVPDPASSSGGAPRTRVDFPHRVHLQALDEGGPAADSLRAGCLACHEVRASSDEAPPWQARAWTNADLAKTCLPCHSDHGAIGGGGCRSCHAPGDPVWLGSDRREGSEPVVQLWPAASGFDHLSPGHEAGTRAGECATCHDPADLKAAQRLSAVPLPAEHQSSWPGVPPHPAAAVSLALKPGEVPCDVRWTRKRRGASRQQEPSDERRIPPARAALRDSR